jgi:hypothetical protein
MGSNQYGKGRAPSFGRSVAMYLGFLLVMAVVALLSVATGGPMTQVASVAQASTETRSDVRIEPPRDDPSLPAAADALSSRAPTSPVEAMAPTF